MNVIPLRANVRRLLRILVALLAATALSLVLVPGTASATTTYTISGQVSLGTTGNTAPAGDVSVWWSAPNGAASTTTTIEPVGALGAYSIPGLTAGSYTLYFAYLGTGGYGSQWWGSSQQSSATITVGPGLVTSGENITLPPSQTVSGHVSLGTATGAAAQSATVSWTYASTSPTGLSDYSGTTTSTQTDSNGNYSVVLPAGWYYFNYHSANSAYQDVHSVFQVVNASAVTKNQVLPAMDTISGHVSLGTPGVPAGAGRVSVTYTCNQPGVTYSPYPDPCLVSPQPSTTVLTDANGNYTIGGIYEDADYTLYATDATDSSYQPTQGFVTISDSTVPATANITMIPSGSLSGTVSLGTAGSFAGAGRVNVTLTCGGYTSYTKTTTTDANGNYQFTGLSESTCILSFADASNQYAGGYWSAQSGANGPPVAILETYTGAQTVNQIAVYGASIPGMNVTLPLGGFISGAVTTSSGSSLTAHGSDQLALEYTNGGVVSSSYTNADGTFSLGPLIPGSYQIHLTSWGNGLALGPTWVGASLADPGYIRTLTLAPGQHITDANAVQFQNSSLTLNVTCTNCTADLDTTDSVVVQGYDSVTSSWTSYTPNALYLPGFYWTSIPPGTYRAVVESYADDSVVAEGSTFTIAEGQSVTSSLSVTLPIPYIPTFLTGGVGDFNSDGNSDVVVRDGNGALWLYPGNGSNALKPRTQLDTASDGWGSATAIIPVGDFTGDGHPDMMARDRSGNLWLYPGNGASGFGTKIEVGLAATWAGMTSIQGVGDFDGDHKPDVIARDSAGVLWLFPNNGSGTGFGTPIQIASGWQGMTGILGAGDWNNDGHADIIARDASGQLWLYPGTGNTQWLGQRVLIGGGWQGLTIISVGDFNNDDSEDILVRDGNGALWLYPGNGTGGFRPRVQIGGGWQGLTIAGDAASILPVVAPVPAAVSGGVGDFDGDGNSDVVVRDGNGTLFLYPGNGGTGFKPRVQLSTIGAWANMTAIVAAGDLNGDGLQDIVARDRAGTLWLYPGNGSNGFGTPEQLGATGAFAGMTAIQGVGDFNGDGHADLLARDAAGDVLLYPGNGTSTNTLGAPITIATGWGSYTGIMGIGDFDGDGKSDVLARDAAGALWLYPGLGSATTAVSGGTGGGFGARVQVGGGWQGITIQAIGDFNNDGHEDIFVRDANGALWLYPGTGVASSPFLPRIQVGGGWEGLTIAGDAASIQPIAPPVPTAVSGGVGDLDGDGNSDVVVRDGNGTLFLYPGNGGTGFLPRSQLSGYAAWAGMTAIVAAGDLNGDGHPDIAGRDAAGTLWLYPGDGAGHLGTPTMLGSADEFAGMTAIQGVGDFNGDGHADLVARDSNGNLLLYPGNGTSTNTLGAPVTIATGWGSFTGIMGIGDFDGDGKSDILARDSAGALWLYPGNGSGGLGARVQVGGGWQGITIQAIGDFKNDGHEDIFVRDANGALWLYPGTGVASSPFLPRIQVGGGWEGLTIAGDAASLPAISTASALRSGVQ
jgi:hypothetical protein